MIQLLICYVLFLLFQSTHLYYSLLYLFIEILFIGFLLLHYQLDLFVGFLWIAEGTIILIFILLLMYLNSIGFPKAPYITIKYKLSFIVMIGVCCLVTLNYNPKESNFYFITDCVLLWDDFYESLHTNVLHDFSIL